MTLSPLDDYPLHQTPEPLLYPATGDRNFYDRYFFNGFTPDAGLYFGAALGVYPNRDVMDAAFSVVRAGAQTSVHASRRAPADRTQTRVGPIAVDVVEPMRRLRVRVGPNDAGIEADLEFSAKTAALEEPRLTRRTGTRVTMDYTRFTQFGAWRGELSVGGERVTVDALGCRDRSWGIRWVGEREQGAPGPPPQFFWLWAPIAFEDVCALAAIQEEADGRRWHTHGRLVGAVDEVMAGVEHRVRWAPGTRRASGAELVLSPRSGDPLSIELEPLLDFQMLGLGYLHPEWGHGMWKGEEAVGAESWRLGEIDPAAPQHLHVQQLCRARMGDRVGTGVLEQLVIGPHEPSGLTGLFDPSP